MKIKEIIAALVFLCFSSIHIHSQNNFEVYVSGLKAGDSAQVTLQKSSESLLQKWAKSSDGSDVNLTFSLDQGKWALSIDATGYTYPTAKVLNIPEDNSAKITLTEIQSGSFTYSWSDDDSAAGHSTQSYYSEPTEIVVLDKTVSVPNDYASIKLRNDFGVVLSDDIKSWSKEDSYRLYKMFSSLPFNENGEGNKVDFSTGEGVRGVFYLTDDEQYKDLTILIDGDLVNATISQSAFTYATPLVVTVDGIKGKFYSKRLYHVVVNYVTNFASNDEMVDWIADGSFGFRFMKPNQETETLMGEDSSNFQEFHDDEKMEILAMFEELPEGFHKQKGLKYMVRRINGQDHPKYKTAAGIAWTGNADYLEDNDTVNDSKMFVIEWMEKAFNSGNIGDLHRLILHEKAHFLWEYTFGDKLRDDWADIGGWFKDPTTASGWSTYNTTESVSAYAHLKNPNEDMAESIAFYITNPDKLLNVSVKKYEFIRDRVMHGTRYVAQIREDLTFTVYNLFPDYTFPGKVTSIDVEVTGEPEEDKQVKITAKLNSVDPQYDGASEIYARFSSSIGTIHDIRLNPVNGSVDSVLVGTTTFNKLEKSGYWTLSYFNVFDKVGNKRFENTSTLGLKLFINNPLEDVIGAQWNYDLEMKVVSDKFKGGNLDGTFRNDEGTEMQAIELTGSVYENRKMERVGFRIINPTLDDPNAQVYERQSWVSEFYKEKVVSDDIPKENEYESNKYIRAYMGIPDYYPSGYYSISMMNFFDKAGNLSDTFFSKDTSDVFIDKSLKLKQFKDVRDSIYVKTEYPDYKKPEIDINNINITAEPTKPKAPDGETQVDITMLARDISDYPGYEAGVYAVDIVLRDPLGNEFRYNTYNGTMQHPQLDGARSSDEYSKYGNGDWKAYDFRILLPQGSAPGKWGISAATVWDRAGNFKPYNFVEYVRFDIIESEIVLTSPLEVEILEKHINAKNVDSISAKMSCVPCKDLNYVYTIYSRMGGGGAVVRGEGKFENDTIVVNNIQTSGVLDGLVNLTVQVTDSTSALVATKTAEYLKDVVYPKAYYTKSNIQDQGWSSLDSIVVAIKVESVDVGGTYSVTIKKSEKTGSFPGSSSQNDLVLSGSIDSEEFNLDDLDFSKVQSGYNKFILTVTDQVGNAGEESVLYYLKDDDRIVFLGNSIDPESDYDNDGVKTKFDDCPTTKEGQKVNVTGCEFFDLPVSNFNIKATSATCIGNSDGLLNLSVEDASVDYTVTITGKDNVTITGDSKTASVSGLAKGTYTVCFKVDGQSSYEQCFDVVVGEPEKLNAFVSVDEDDKKVSITMSGSNVYNVEINGKRTTVSSGSFTTELNTGLSIIKVYTDLECQGSIEQEVFVSEDIHYYPNPTDNDVKVHVGGEDQQVKVSIFTTAGVLVYTQEQTIEDITRKTQIDLSKQQTGTYVVVMESKTVRKTFKIIRE
jgi:hypothetical protein